MRTDFQCARPRRLARTARPVPRAARIRNLTSTAPVANQGAANTLTPLATPQGPHVDYSRFLTPEGGILVVYKDIDPRLRYLLWRALAWATATGVEAWLLLWHSPLHHRWINVTCLLVMAGINFLIVRKPPELYRQVEIRPDCMILEGADVFWLRLMENGLPSFQPDEKSNLVLCGIYGTRFVEYLIARKFDDDDRVPEVLAAHIQEAMNQLWAPALGFDAVRSGEQPWRR